MTDTLQIPDHIYAKRPRAVFKSLGVPIYIFAPDYRQNSGGIRVLHFLCHILNEMGEEAYLINARIASPNLRTPRLTFERFREHFLTGRNPVTLYPEVVHDNPFNTPLIARWLLNIPGHLGKPVEFEDKDLIFYYEPWCLPSHMKGQFLHVDPLDYSIFNNLDNPHDHNRTLECYYANKYFLQGQPIRNDHQGLTSLGQEIKRSHLEIASMLRMAKVLYCYEPSGIINEAQACGCPVLLVRSDYWKLPAHDSHHELPGVAICGDDGALEKARLGLEQVSHSHRVLRDNSWSTALNFIESVYDAHQDHLCNGKPILNDVQGLWKSSISEREAVIDRFDQIYSRSPLLLHAHVVNRVTRAPFINRYREYLERSSPKEFEVQILAERLVQMKAPPKMHLLVPVRSHEEAWLFKSLDSVQVQLYPHWRVTVVSELLAPPDWVESVRTQWLALKDAVHIAYVIDEMAAASDADWLATLSPGVTLNFEALLLMADAIDQHPDWCLIYTDEDAIEEDGRHVAPRFKPGFNLELLRSHNFLGQLVLFRKDAYLAAGRFGRHQGAQAYDLTLRLADQLTPNVFGRLSRTLVHVPVSAQSGTETQEVEAQALLDHFDRRGLTATVHPGLQANSRHVRYQSTSEASISIALPVSDDINLARRFLADICTLTVEDIIVLDTGGDPDMGEFLQHLVATPEWADRMTVHPASTSDWPRRAAELARGDLIYLTTPSAAGPTPEQMAEMVCAMNQPAVAAVAPRLVVSDQPGAPVINADWVWLGLSENAPAVDDPGPLGMNLCAHEKRVINQLPLLLNKTVFLELGGLDLDQMLMTDAMVDFCLRLANSDRTLVWTPHVTLPYRGPVQQTSNPKSRRFLIERHINKLVSDPSLHPMWSLDQPGEFEHSMPLSWTDAPSHAPRLLVLATDSEPASANRFYLSIKRWQDAAEVQLVVADLRSRPMSALTVAKLMPDAIVIHASRSAPVLTMLEEFRTCLPEVPVIVRLETIDFLEHGPNQKDIDSRPALRRILKYANRVVTTTPELAQLCEGLAEQVVCIPFNESTTAQSWLSPNATSVDASRNLAT